MQSISATTSTFFGPERGHAHARGAAWCRGDSRLLIRTGTSEAPERHCFYCAAPRAGEPLNAAHAPELRIACASVAEMALPTVQLGEAGAVQDWGTRTTSGGSWMSAARSSLVRHGHSSLS